MSRWFALAAAATLLLAPASALAQKGKGKGKPTTPAPTGAGGTDELDQPTTPPAGEPPPTPPAGDTGAGAGGAGGGICEIDPSACPKGEDLGEAAKRKVKADIYAVEQIYALRYHRLEVQPYWSFTLNDQFVSHPGPGLSLNYYLTNVLAIGINGNLYAGLNGDSDFNFQNRRATRVAVPLNEYQWSAAFDFTYVPVYGKFAGFSNFIFSYDIFVDGGVGAISTRPIPVIDPDNRKFDFQPKIAFNIGIGLRIFLTKWLAANLMIADYIYPEKLESLTIANGPVNKSSDPNSPSNPSTWLQDGVSVTNNVQAQLGISVFLPFSFNYRLPK
jgi:outer membrane beta-barrel protein